MMKMWTFLILVLGVFSTVALPAADLQEGIKNFEAKKFKEAEVFFRRIVAAEPQNIDARYYRGASLLELGNAKEAVVELQRADRLNGKEGRIKFALTRAYIELSQLDLAEKVLQSAEQQGLLGVDFYKYRGLLKTKRNQNEAAAADFLKALEIEPKDAYSHYYLGMTYSRLGRPDKMVEHFQYFLTLAPDSPDAQKVRAFLRSAG